MYPHYQHAHGTIYLQVPRNMSKEHNPEQQKIHMVTINFPAHKIVEQVQCSLVMTELFESLPQGFELPQLGDIEYHLIKFTAQDCIVSGENLPKLLNEDHQEQVQAAISFAQSRQRQDPIDITILVEGDSTMAFAETSSFNIAIRAEKKEDLLMAFYELTPCAKVLQLGNIIDFEARPDIPVQPAHLVFGDSMEYQVPHIMGATYEQEYRDFVINDYAEIDFESSWVELSTAKPNPSMPANAYLVYVRKGHFELENLQNGDQVEVSLCEEFEEATPHDEVRSGSGDDLLSGQGAIAMAAETDELTGTLLHLKGTIPQHELVEYEIGGKNAEAIQSKTDRDLEFGYDDSEPDQEPNIWHGVVTATVICPEAYFGILLECPRIQNWKGDKKDQPFITTNVPCISDHAKSLDELQAKIESNKQFVKIKIKPIQDRQAYKDDIQSITELFRSQDEGKCSLQEYIQG